jgi:hypothetical protein
LIIRGVVKMSAQDSLGMRFNSDSGNHYSSVSGNQSEIQIAGANGNGNCFCAVEVHIPLYTDATNGGSAFSDHVDADQVNNSAQRNITGGRWWGAAAITDILIRPDSGTITGTLDLYGVS